MGEQAVPAQIARSDGAAARLLSVLLGCGTGLAERRYALGVLAALPVEAAVPGQAATKCLADLPAAISSTLPLGHELCGLALAHGAGCAMLGSKGARLTLPEQVPYTATELRPWPRATIGAAAAQTPPGLAAPPPTSGARAAGRCPGREFPRPRRTARR